MAAENLTRDEARERARILNVASYDVHLDLRSAPSDSTTFRSTSTVVFGCLEPGASTHIDLTADRIVEATLNDAPVDVSSFTGQRLTLPSLESKNVLRIVADCVFSRTGEGLHRFHDPVDDETYLYSQFETFDAHRMYACFDQPDLKSTFAFCVDAPAGWRVLSNMPSTRDGERHDFAPTPKQSSYITTIVAGPYVGVEDSHDGIPLGVYCRKAMLEHLDADDMLVVTKQGFDAYHELFGLRYPWPKYDQVFVPEFNMGAMENAGCVTFTENLIFRSRVTDAAYEQRATVVLHEMAHMWFGDLVTMSWWDDLWLNESFAEYVSTQVQAESTRFHDVWTTFATREKAWAYRQDQLPTTHPIAADIPDIEAVTTNFDGITYAKGASVLKQLVHWVGRDHFFSATRAYFDRHAYANTTLQDFLDALSEASGRDMSAWSKEWLESAGVNTLRPQIEVSPDGTFTSFAVRQEATGEQPTLRSHRLRIGLFDDGPDGLVRTRQVELDIAGDLTDVPDLVGTKQPALVLLNDDDLTYTKVRMDPHSWETLVSSIGSLRDPLARALCWSAAWDMTRDAEVSGSDYLDLVIRGVGQESEIGTIQNLLRLAAQVIDGYLDPAGRTEQRTRLAATAFDLVDISEAGSDRQLAFARAAARNALTEEQLDRLAGLLSGARPAPGLVIDTELRWALLDRLVVTGRAGEVEIAAERERDDTGEGHRHALRLRAAMPTAEAKAQAWQAIVESDQLSNEDQEAVVAGFQQYEQRELLAPYVEPYFQAVGRLYRERTAEMAQRLIEGLYPITADSQATVDRTDASLRDDQPGPALRRMLLESRDGLARALRAQARDRSTS